MNRVINSCNLYFLVCVLCMLNGVLFTGGSSIIVGLQGLFIFSSIVYAFLSNIKYKVPTYFKGLNILLVLFSIYGILLILSGKHLIVGFNGEEVSRTTYLKNIYLSFLPIYAFYYFAKNKQLYVKLMRFWCVVFCAIAVVNFIYYRIYALAIVNTDDVTNNAAYGFVGLLPAVVLFDKKHIMKYIYLIFCLFFIIVGMKRGAIFVSLVSLLWLWLFSFHKADHKKKWGFVFLAVLVLVAGWILISYMMNTSDFFNYRIAQTTSNDTSGRSSLYSDFYEHFIHESNLFKFLFGNGASATLKIGDNYAHNDWLEIAINQGVLGLFVYVYYWICFYKTWRSSKNNTEAFMAIGMVMIIYFIMTLFSMSYDGMSRGATMILGYYLAIYSMKEQKNQHKIPIGI